MLEPTIESNAAGQHTDLCKYVFRCLLADAICLAFGIFVAPLFSNQYGIDIAWAWSVVEVIGGAALLSPVFWLIWGRHRQRFWVRGYCLTISVFSVMCVIFFIALIFPILCLVDSTLWRSVIFTAIAIIAIHILWRVWQETQRTMKKLHYPERAFVDTGDVIVFDLSVIRKWGKTRREVVTASKLEFYFFMCFSPIAPVLGVFFGDYDTIPAVPIFSLLCAPYLARYVWSKLPVCIGALLVYPIYLEFKIGKPVIEIGSTL